MLKSKLFIPVVITALVIIVGIVYLSGIFSSKTSPLSNAERGISITPKSAKEFLTDPDIERWAVIVGVSDYKNSPRIANLKYADRDAQAFYDFLVSAQGGAFKPDHIQLLTNEKATVKNMRWALGTFLGKTSDKDLVVIFLAGHGAPDARKWENLYFLTYDAEPDSFPDTAYPMWEMETALQRFIKAKRVIVITDACHSAALSGGMIAMRGNEGYRVSEYMKKLVESREGCTFITASRAGEGSQESAQWGGGHGVFTYFLLEGLKGKADRNRDGFVTIKETYDYLYPKVQRESENGQTPFASAYLDNSIPIGICEPDKLGITSKVNPSETKINENKPNDVYKQVLKQGVVSYFTNDSQKAIELFKEAIRLKPDDAGAHYYLGMAYVMSGNYQKAIESFKEAIRIKPDDALAHYEFGKAYAQSKDYQKAIASHKEAIRLKPDFAEAHCELGIAYAQSKDYQKAIASYKEAIRIKPDDAGAHVILGIAYAQLEDYPKAIKSLKEAIRIKPDNALAHYGLGCTYLELGDRGSALDEYKILKDLDKEIANKLFNEINE